MSQRDRVSAPIPDRSATDVLFNSPISPETTNGRPTITDRMREWEQATAADETRAAQTRSSAADILFEPSASDPVESSTPAPDLEGLREWRQQIKDDVADEPEPEQKRIPPPPPKRCLGLVGATMSFPVGRKTNR